jgi:hypothetical protein
MKKPVSSVKQEKTPKAASEKPKRLSKLGEWMRANPEGILVIHDMRAVMR